MNYFNRKTGFVSRYNRVLTVKYGERRCDDAVLKKEKQVRPKLTWKSRRVGISPCLGVGSRRCASLRSCLILQSVCEFSVRAKVLRRRSRRRNFLLLG